MRQDNACLTPDSTVQRNIADPVILRAQHYCVRITQHTIIEIMFYKVIVPSIER